MLMLREGASTFNFIEHVKQGFLFLLGQLVAYAVQLTFTGSKTQGDEL